MKFDGLKLVRIHATYFCCGVFIDTNGIVKDAAPIVNWSRGKHYSVIEKFLERKKALIEIRIIE